MIPNNKLGAAVEAYIKANPSSDLEARTTGRSPVITLHGTVIPTDAELEAAYAEVEAEENILIAKETGFDYNGTMVSYTAHDRNTVTNADVAFEKSIGGTSLIPDGSSINLTFDNGNTLAINKTDFNATFLPAFYAAASAGLVV